MGPLTARATRCAQEALPGVGRSSSTYVRNRTHAMTRAHTTKGAHHGMRAHYYLTQHALYVQVWLSTGSVSEQTRVALDCNKKRCIVSERTERLAAVGEGYGAFSPKRAELKAEQGPAGHALHAIRTSASITQRAPSNPPHASTRMESENTQPQDMQSPAAALPLADALSLLKVHSNSQATQLPIDALPLSQEGGDENTEDEFAGDWLRRAGFA